MTGIPENGLNRRSLLGAIGAGAGAMLLGGCATYEGRVTNVIERLLLLSSQCSISTRWHLCSHSKSLHRVWR